MKKIISATSHPLFVLNFLIIGFFIVVGMIHNHAHHTMELDVDSYVRKWCKKNDSNRQSCKNFSDPSY